MVRCLAPTQAHASLLKRSWLGATGGKVLALLLALGAVSGCGKATSTVAEAPSQLDGLTVQRPDVVIGTPDGIAVALGNYGGHPAVFVPKAGGGYKWVSDEAAPSLEGMVAWRDGNSIRVIGHDCSLPSKASVQSTADDELGTGCPAAPLRVLEFSLRGMSWSDKPRTISTGGAIISVRNGHGQLAFATTNNGTAVDGMLILDVISGSRTDVSSSNTPAGVVACPAEDGFVVAKGDTSLTAEPGSGISGSFGPEAGPIDPLEFQMFTREGLSPLVVEWNGLDHPVVRMTVAGCLDGGVVVTSASSPYGPYGTVLLVPAGSVGSLRATPIPAAGMNADPDGSGPVEGILIDRTGSTLVATSTVITESEADRRSTVTLWDEAKGEWVRLDAQIPYVASVAVSDSGEVFAVEPSSIDDTEAFHSISPGNGD